MTLLLLFSFLLGGVVSVKTSQPSPHLLVNLSFDVIDDDSVWQIYTLTPQKNDTHEQKEKQRNPSKGRQLHRAEWHDHVGWHEECSNTQCSAFMMEET